ASRTSARSDSSTLSSSGLSGYAAQFGQNIANFHTRRTALPKCEIQLAIEGENLLAGGRLRRLGFDGHKARTKLILGCLDAGERPGGHESKDCRTEASDIALRHQNGFAHHVGIHLVEHPILLRDASAVDDAPHRDAVLLHALQDDARV